MIRRIALKRRKTQVIKHKNGNKKLRIEPIIGKFNIHAAAEKNKRGTAMSGNVFEKYSNRNKMTDTTAEQAI